MFVLQLNQRKLKKLEKDYQCFLEQQSQLEDPVVRLEVGITIAMCVLHTLTNCHQLVFNYKDPNSKLHDVACYS